MPIRHLRSILPYTSAEDTKLPLRLIDVECPRSLLVSVPWDLRVDRQWVVCDVPSSGQQALDPRCNGLRDLFSQLSNPWGLARYSQEALPRLPNISRNCKVATCLFISCLGGCWKGCRLPTVFDTCISDIRLHVGANIIDRTNYFAAHTRRIKTAGDLRHPCGKQAITCMSWNSVSLLSCFTKCLLKQSGRPIHLRRVQTNRADLGFKWLCLETASLCQACSKQTISFLNIIPADFFRQAENIALTGLILTRKLLWAASRALTFL